MKKAQSQAIKNMFYQNILNLNNLLMTSEIK